VCNGLDVALDFADTGVTRFACAYLLDKLGGVRNNSDSPVAGRFLCRRDGAPIWSGNDAEPLCR
jgi:hypothetical protein